MQNDPRTRSTEVMATNLPIQITALLPQKVEGVRYFSHFQQLERDGFIRVKYLEYSLAKQVRWILTGYENSPIRRVASNLVELVRLLTGRNRIVVFGAPAFDLSVLFANRLRRRHRCIFYTSWPYWEPASLEELRLPAWRQRTWARFLDGAVCVTVTPHPVNALRAYGAECRCIPYAVDTDLFRPAAKKSPGRPKRVLFVGTLLKCKGISVLLDAIASRQWEGVRFAFVGRGPLLGKIMNQVKMGQPVEYLGHHTESNALLRHYRDADVFVLPSITTRRDEEKFGLVLLEAMACGLPIITTDCIGPRQIVQDGHTGLMIAQNDAAALANAIGTLVGDDALRARLGHNARRCAEESYGLRTIADRWRSLISRVAGLEEGRDER